MGPARPLKSGISAFSEMLELVAGCRVDCLEASLAAD
jgi:hypothetical protein